MEELYSSVSGTHRGITYATIVIFGAFICLFIRTQMTYEGKITEVLRKIGFFSMGLLFMLAILSFFKGIYSAEFPEVSGFREYLIHFGETIHLLISAGIMTMVYLFLKEKDTLTMKIFVLGLTSALFFHRVVPWIELLGF